MDADLSDRCMNYYTNICHKKINSANIAVLRNNYTPYQNYKIKYMRYECWLSKLMDTVKNDKKIAVPMASNNKEKDLQALLEKQYPNKNILLIHKETKDEEKLQQLLKVNENWVNYDVVIYTPTVCMGVSFDPKYFDNIFAYGCHNSLGAQEFCQMIHRVRHPKDSDIYLCIDHYKYFKNEDDTCSYEEVERIMCNDYFLTKYDMHSNLMKRKVKREEDERVYFYPYKDEPIYDLQVRNNMEKIVNDNNFAATFFGYTKFKKYQYEYYDTDKDDTIMTSIKEIRESRKKKEDEDEVNGLNNAKILNETEYKEIVRKRDEYWTDANRFQVRKYNFMKIYDIKKKDMTKEIISEYRDKKMMSHYRNLSTIVSSEKQDTKEKINILKNNQTINLDYRNCYQILTQNNKYVYHYYCTKILDHFGVDINKHDDLETYIPIEDIEKNINGDFEIFLRDEMSNLIQKFGIRKNQYKYEKFKNDPNLVIKFINLIMNKQYGLKLIKTNYSKKKIRYYLSSGKKWDNLPHKSIKGKDIKKIIKNDPHVVDNTDDLELGVAMSDSEDEVVSDNEIENEYTDEESE